MGTWVDHLGHTSFCITRGGLRILVDPLIVRQEPDFRRPTCARWLFEDLTGFDAIFISHGHNDHLHPPSLLGFPPDIPIYYLDEDAEGCSCDDTPERMLGALGFRNLKPFVPGQVISLAEDVRVHAIPARGSTEGEEQCCFLVETPDVLMFNGVDIQDAPVTRQALEAFRGRVDVAFVPTGASLQWEGFWNQMDAVDALAFCEWLRPARVASCGGTVSLSERPRQGTLERYPNDFADWLATATARLGREQLLLQRPPFRLHYESHRLLRTTPLQPDQRFHGGSSAPRPQALLTTYFTGYHPRLSTKRASWPDDSLSNWLTALQPLRDVVHASPGELHHLVKRTGLAFNKTPAGVLAPCTLRRSVEGGATALAAQLSACIPSPPAEPAELDVTFFAVAEALVENASGPVEPLRPELRTCLWIDRNLFHLRHVAMRLRGLRSFPERAAERLRAEHRETLRRTVDQRRPVLGPHHLRLAREQEALLTGRTAAPDSGGLLCYPSPSGLQQHPLSALEALLLDHCDGRTFAEIVDVVAQVLELPASEVHPALFNLLTDLSLNSVILLDWSQS